MKAYFCLFLVLSSSLPSSFFSNAEPALDGKGPIVVGEEMVDGDHRRHNAEVADALRIKTAAEHSLLKGRKEYSEGKAGGGGGGDGDHRQIGPFGKEAATDALLEPFGQSESGSRGKIGQSGNVADLEDAAAARPTELSSAESGAAINELDREKQRDVPAQHELGQRLYHRIRVRQCAGWCGATLAPWYSDLASVNCNRTNECVKSPENGADCGRRCETIVKNLPVRPVLGCPLYCDLAYAGLQKTLDFCKKRCPPS